VPGDKVASFSVRVLAESNARATSGELEELKASIASSTETAKLLTAGMRSLKGSSEEVITTKNALKAALEAERASISAASLAIMAQGTSYESLVAKEQSALKAKKALDEGMKKQSGADAKKALDEIKWSQDELKKSQDELEAKTEGMRQALSTVSGPLGELQGKFEKFTGIIEKTGPATAIAVLGIAAVTAAVVAMSAALVEGSTSLAKFILESGNLQRSRQLQLEATSGSADNARAWKNEIDDLARHIATPREELNALANETNAAFVQTRISGQGIIDSYEAIAKESEAMGKTAGGAIRSLLEQGKNWGRGGLNPQDLMGKGLGIQFQDVAGALAKNLNIGLGQAQQALLMGGVKLDDRAKAVHDAIEKRFGDVNARKLLDLNVIINRLRESFTALTENVNLEPILKGVREIASWFDVATVSGDALRQLITTIGDLMGSAFTSSIPTARSLFKSLIITVQDIVIDVLRFRNAAQGMVPDDLQNKIEIIKIGFVGLTASLGGLGIAAVVAFAPFLTMAATFAAIGAGIGIIVLDFKHLFSDLKQLPFDQLLIDAGKAIVEGLEKGILSAFNRLRDTVVGLGTKIKGWFSTSLEIRSPSAVFRSYGEDTAEGYRQGVDKGSSGVRDAVEGMAPEAPAALGERAASVGSGAGAVTLTIGTIEVHVGGKDGESAAHVIQGPTFRAQLTQALIDALQGAGVPTRTAQAGIP
jgi:hypothetical protein